MPTKKTFADWIGEHGKVLDTLDPQAPLDDLEQFGEMIGDTRVVAIGENAHYVREFYLLRHRLFRFLAERCGFTVYVMEAPFTEAQVIDRWMQGGTGTVAEVASAGIAFGMGRRREMYHHLSWMRAHNHKAASPLRFMGGGLPASGGSPLLALEEVADYLRAADPDALPLLEEAMKLVRDYHSAATYESLFRYTALDAAKQDALSATLGRLLSRMETMDAYQRGQHPGLEHATAIHHMRGAWYLDHFHRQFAGRGISSEHPHALHDAFMAASVIRLLENRTDDTRIVLAYHNIHIQKRPLFSNGAVGTLPGGYLLNQALGDDFFAIGVTSHSGRTARVRPNPENPVGYEISDVPLPPLADNTVEAAFANMTSPIIANLQAAHLEISNADTFQRLRMEDSFMDLPIFDAFDAVINLPQTSVSEEA